MASDIFFGGNTNVSRFGGYEPSSRKTSAFQRKLKQDQDDLEIYRQAQLQEDAQLQEARDALAYSEYHEPQEENHNEDLIDGNYHEEQQEAYHEYEKPPIPRQVSNVFEDNEQPVFRGARRHFQGNQHSSDIFFQQDAPKTNRFSSQEKEQFNSTWVPSVKVATSKSSSFSNIFGDSYNDVSRQSFNDVSRQASFTDNFKNDQEKQVSGLSSENLNRDKRGRARKGVTTSQIWF